MARSLLGMGWSLASTVAKLKPCHQMPMPGTAMPHVEMTCLQGLADLERLEGPWLITMAELFDNKEEPLCLLDLMNAAKLCRSSVPVKTDCNNRETADYNNCLRWAKRLKREGFITEHRDESGTAGSQRRRLLELTQDGRNYVGRL